MLDPSLLKQTNYPVWGQVHFYFLSQLGLSDHQLWLQASTKQNSPEPSIQVSVLRHYWQGVSADQMPAEQQGQISASPSRLGSNQSTVHQLKLNSSDCVKIEVPDLWVNECQLGLMEKFNEHINQVKQVLKQFDDQ